MGDGWKTVEILLEWRCEKSMGKGKKRWYYLYKDGYMVTGWEKIDKE